jgi:hypothetical protein
MFAEIYCIQPTSVRRWERWMQSALKFEVEPDWLAWKQGVVAAIRDFLQGTLSEVSEADVDWDAWRSFYESGCSPSIAVSRAYLREI